MATVAFSTMVGELSPHVQGVPDPVLEHYIRKIVIDLCERGKVWRVYLSPQTLLSGIYTYPLTSPVVDTEVSSILSTKMTLASSSNSKILDIVSDDQMRATYQFWPDLDHLAEPRAVTRFDAQSFQVGPVPGAADTYTVSIFATIRPTMTATGWEGTLMDEFRRTIFHGVLFELMMMPDRPWSNDKLAMYHGKQWDYMLWSAKARANKGFGPASIGVKMKPWA